MNRSSTLFALLCAAAVSMAQAQTPTTPETPASPPAQTEIQAPIVPGSATPGQPAEQLVVTDVKVGAGKEAISGHSVRVHYTGWLYRPLAKKFHGRQFDSSFSRGEPLEFTLGAGRVIKGWEQGVVGMKVGGKRTLIIPPELAYGARSVGDIPANSALIFDVELVEVK